MMLTGNSRGLQGKIGTTLPPYSLGVGDRFGHEAAAQLKAFVRAADNGLAVAPVWNKSFREHSIVGSKPEGVLEAAREAVDELDWKGAWFVDADHISEANVDAFTASGNYFTLDVAEAIGEPPAEADLAAFLKEWEPYAGTVAIDGIEGAMDVSMERIEETARRYLRATGEAGRIYRKIEASRGVGTFVTEVSMDETDAPQTPLELLVILAALAREGVPVQAIAPKFTGRFNKGVDYVGDVGRFCREFEDDVCVIAHAVRTFGLPANLKLSVHSGSDKFSLYGPVAEIIRRRQCGIHLKTAGTTWLEELIGLARAGGSGLKTAVDIYCSAWERIDELCAPYASLVDITAQRLPPPDEVQNWSAEEYSATLQHDPDNPRFNPDFRQLLHVAYGVAAQMGARFTDGLTEHADIIGQHVFQNIYHRHLERLFTP